MTQQERLKEAIEKIKTHFGIHSNFEFSKALGYRSTTYLSDIIGGHKPMSDLFLEKLEREFSVSSVWVKSGTGSMFLGSIPAKTNLSTTPPDEYDYDENNKWHPDEPMKEIMQMVDRHIMAMNKLEKEHNDNISKLRKEYYDKMVKYKQLIFKILYHESIIYRNIAALKDGINPENEKENFEKRKQEILIEMMRIENPEYTPGSIGFDPSVTKSKP